MSADEKVTIKIGGASRKLSREALVCVVYLGEIGESDGEPVEHNSPTIFGADAAIFGSLAMMTIEAGASMVRAGLLADQLAADPPDELLVLKMERGEIAVYEDAAAVFALPMGTFRRILSVTRHGVVLRAWEALAAAAARPNRSLLEGIKRRLKLFGEFAPVEIGSLATIQGDAKKVARLRAPAQASA